jgi:hypothetical protein
MDKSELVSRREAARLLGCAAVTVDRIAERNRLKRVQIPGHQRKFYYRAEIVDLLTKAVSIVTLGGGA